MEERRQTTSLFSGVVLNKGENAIKGNTFRCRGDNGERTKTKGTPFQWHEKQKRKLEVVSPREDNGTCQKRLRYNQPSEPRSKIVMKKYRKETFEGARLNVNHSYGTRLKANRRREFEFSHEENDEFEKKRNMSEFSSDENGNLNKRRKHVETSDQDAGYMHGNETEISLNERKRKRKVRGFHNKVDFQIKGKWNCKETNQACNVMNPQIRYSTKEEHSLTVTTAIVGFEENENPAKVCLIDGKSANESIQWTEMVDNGLDTYLKEYMHQIDNETFGEDQTVLTDNAFQNQILEVFSKNFNSSCHSLELARNQEDINNNKPTSQQTYEAQLPYKNSGIKKSDINMNETVLIIQRLDGIDITNIGLCNEPFAAIDKDLYQDYSCLYPTIKDLKIQVDHYEDNDYPNLANPTSTGSYIESMNTSTSVTHTNVTVKQEPIWDDYENETDCTEDDENENDSGDIDLPSSTRSELRIRPIKRRKRVMVPLRIRLLKNQMMRKAWKESTTCCLKYCWIDWPSVTVGQI